MALITWQDLVERSKIGRGPIKLYPKEAKKAFDWIIKNSEKIDLYKTLSAEDQLTRISNLINENLNRNNNKFIPGPGRVTGPRSGYTYNELAKNKYFKPGFINYLEAPSPGNPRTPKMKEIIKSTASLEDKWNRLDHHEKVNARASIARFEARQGILPLKDFAPLTNFKANTIRINILEGRKKLPADPFTAEHTKIARGKEFLKFFKDNGIKIIQRGDKGNIFFPDPDKAQRIALTRFLNELDQRAIDIRARALVRKHSKDNPLYKNTQGNLKTVLRQAQKNLNATIEGYSNVGLRRYLEKHPNMLKNATMWFNSETGTFKYTRPDQLKSGFNFDKLRKNLKFEIEHNRSLNSYVRKMTDGESVFAKYKLLNDAEFAHNLTLDTRRYNEAKEQAVKWMERNPTKTTQIANIDAELAKLGHRVYAGDQWRGRELKFKPGYRGTVVDSWITALKQSSGLNLKDFVPEGTWARAIKEVEHSPTDLRRLGNLFGCPQTFGRAEGGRIGFQAGGTGLSACVSTKLKQPGAIEKIAALPKEVGGALGKLKNTATSFLGMLGRGGLKAAPLAALAAAGAAVEPLVKQFRIDDPTTYLTDESQMKGMLLATIEGETPKVDEELLNWQYPGMAAATVAGAVPGAGEVYKARRSGVPLDRSIGPVKGVGKTRAALGLSGVLGKALGASFSPLAVAATLPISVAAQRAGGTDYGDIATDPFNWMGPAFASTGAEMASKGIQNPMLLKALRMGMSPRTLSLVSRRFGLPGLAVSAGMWGYDKWKNRGVNDPED